MSNSSSCGSCGQPHGTWATDRLTSLLDRWGWDARAPRLLAGSASTALVVIDLDNFKHVNDRHGHVAGDAVLKAVADTLRDSTRKGDLLGRYGGHGGDEFLVMLPETDLDEAIVVAGRIQRAIRALVVPAPVAGGSVLIDGITASFGVAIGQPGAELEALVVEADSALRKAKNTGRDRIRARGKRSLRVPLALAGACAAGAVVFAIVADAPPVEQVAAEPPPVAPAPTTVTLPPITVPTTVTMTATPPPPPPRPVVPVQKPRHTQPSTTTTTPTSTQSPEARTIETPPRSSRKPCRLCDMVSGIMDFMPR